MLTVGTDCAIGKMSVALELRRAAQAAGRSAVFVATGQTGMMIEGWGVAVDRVAADFAPGHRRVDGRGRASRAATGCIVEGQGSLDHPAYSSVTLGLIHGATPHAMVMVHKPGMAEHDFDHLPDARFPIAPLRPFIASTRRSPGSSRRRRSWRSRSTPRSIADDDEARRVIAATAAETGPAVRRSGPLRRRRAVARDRARRSTRCRGRARGADDRAAVRAAVARRRPGLTFCRPAADARPAAARPVPDRPVLARGGQVATTVVVELRDEPTARTVGRARRGLSRTGTTARRPRPCRPSCRSCSMRSSPSRPSCAAIPRPLARRWTRPRTGWPRPSPTTARPSAPSTSPSTTSSASGWASRSARCSASTADIPPTDFTLGIDEPAVVAERARRAADFPALKIKVGGPADLATLGRCAAVYDGPIRVDANTGWTPASARRAAAGARAARRRADRAAVPRPPARRAARPPGALAAADRRRRERGDDGRPRRARGRRRPASTSSSRSAAGSARRARMLARARELGFRTFLGCMEETSVGIAGVGGRRVAGRLGRPRRQPAARRRPVRRPRARRRQALAAADAPGLGSLRRPAATDAAVAARPQLSADLAGLSTDRSGCGQVGGRQGGEPLPTPGPGPTMYRSPVAEETRGRERPARPRQTPPAAGGPGPPPD